MIFISGKAKEWIYPGFKPAIAELMERAKSYIANSFCSIFAIMLYE